MRCHLESKFEKHEPYSFTFRPDKLSGLEHVCQIKTRLRPGEPATRVQVKEKLDEISLRCYKQY